MSERDRSLTRDSVVAAAEAAQPFGKRVDEPCRDSGRYGDQRAVAAVLIAARAPGQAGFAKGRSAVAPLRLDLIVLARP